MPTIEKKPINLNSIHSKSFYSPDQIEFAKIEIKQDIFRYQSSIDQTERLIEELSEIVESEREIVEKLQLKLYNMVESGVH